MNYETCLKLKVLGLYQKRHTGARYFITPDFVMNSEDLGSLQTKTGEYGDITPFVYIPTIEDVLAFLGPNFGEVRRMVNTDNPEMNVCAFAFQPIDDSGLILRAFGAGMKEALANLAIAVYGGKTNTPVQGI